MTVQEQIVTAANRNGVDPLLALAVARRESGFVQERISPAGAIGVMQLMPATAAWLGVDPYNLADNVEGGVRYLGQLLRQYGGDVSRALAAYNWGPGNLAEAIARYGERWAAYLPQETKTYLRDVLSELGSLPEYPGSISTGGTVVAVLAGALLLLWVVS